MSKLPYSVLGLVGIAAVLDLHQLLPDVLGAVSDQVDPGQQLWCPGVEAVDPAEVCGKKESKRDTQAT